MGYRDPETRKQFDRERTARRTAERAARGECIRCGKRPPATHRTICQPCTDRRNRASRARDARLRAEGKPRRDPERARAYERERSRQVTETRRAAGLCVRCGQPAVPERSACEQCLDKRRAADRARYRAAKAAGKLYGGRDPAGKRKAARVASRKRQKACLNAGKCTRCGRRPPLEGGSTCEPCRIAKRQLEREIYAARRAAGSASAAVARPRTAVRDVRPAP